MSQYQPPLNGNYQPLPSPDLSQPVLSAEEKTLSEKIALCDRFIEEIKQVSE